jgi:hypothetical protein
MADTLERLLGDPGLQARLVAGGRARVEAEFDFAARMRKEERFYTRVRNFRPHGAT